MYAESVSIFWLLLLPKQLLLLGLPWLSFFEIVVENLLINFADGVDKASSQFSSMALVVSRLEEAPLISVGNINACMPSIILVSASVIMRHCGISLVMQKANYKF